MLFFRLAMLQFGLLFLLIPQAAAAQFPADLVAWELQLKGDKAGAIKKWREGCDAGIGQSCKDWALFASSTLSASERKAAEARAEQLWKAQCSQGRSSSCQSLAYYTFVMSERDQLLKLAYKYAELECRQKRWQESCYRSGKLAFEGHSTNLDPQKEELDLRLACAQTGVHLFETMTIRDVAPIACYELGILHYIGKKRPQDLTLARSFFRSGCSGNWAAACTAWGEILYFGEGGEKNWVEARKAFEKSCSRRDPEGCLSLSDMLYDGQGGPKDVQRAAELADFACSDFMAPERCDDDY